MNVIEIEVYRAAQYHEPLRDIATENSLRNDLLSSADNLSGSIAEILYSWILKGERECFKIFWRQY